MAEGLSRPLATGFCLTGNRTVVDRSPPSPIAFGFLTVLQDASGLAGRLPGDQWLGPAAGVSFETAVQPIGVQAVLYWRDPQRVPVRGPDRQDAGGKDGHQTSLVVTDRGGGAAVAIAVEMPVVRSKSEGSYRQALHWITLRGGRACSCRRSSRPIATR